VKIRLSFALVLGLGSLVAATPLFAHHSFNAQYDRAKPTTLKGTVKRVDWINPHARFFVEVKDAAGKAVLWEIELSAPAGLMRQGWTRNSLKIGDEVTVNGSLAKDGSNLANATTVILANGKRVFAGSSGGDGETAPPTP
jgi:hypothetical protein